MAKRVIGGHFFTVKVKNCRNAWTFVSFQTLKLIDKCKPYLQFFSKFSKDENTQQNAKGHISALENKIDLFVQSGAFFYVSNDIGKM